MKILDFLKDRFSRKVRCRISHYDIHYEIDPIKGIFNSTQEITFTFSGNGEMKILEGILESRLVVDALNLFDKETGEEIPIQWKAIPFEDTYIRREGREGISSQIIEITLNDPLRRWMELLLKLNFHMPEYEIEKSKPLYIWSLSIHPEASYSVEPQSGHYLMLVPSNVSAPFDITIKYPKIQFACIPGILQEKKLEGDYLIEHYKSETRNVPVFAISKYNKIVRESEGFGIEFYLYPHQEVNNELVEKLFKIVQLFVQTFGDNGTRFYKFATVGETNSTTNSAENKGNAIFVDESYFSEFLTSPENFEDFLSINAHEIYHNWNLFYAGVVGTLGEWFGEGGANFIAAWAVEQVLSKAAAARIRKSFIEKYIENEGFIAKESLANAAKISGRKSFALMYYFGALVWEQLRLKIGDKALFVGLRSFFEKYAHQSRTYDDFFECVQNETSVNIEKFMDQWTNYHTKIDLVILAVVMEEKNGNYETTLEIQIDSNRNYELLIEIGYKDELDKDFTVISQGFGKKGNNEITITSKKKPILIQIDPYYRIPQINLDNSIWQKEKQS